MTGLALTKLADSNKIYIDSLESQYVKDPSYTSSFKVKELASHIAGIPHDTPGRDNTEIVDPKNHKSPFEIFSVFASHPLLFESGNDRSGRVC